MIEDWIATGRNRAIRIKHNRRPGQRIVGKIERDAGAPDGALSREISGSASI